MTRDDDPGNDPIAAMVRGLPREIDPPADSEARTAEALRALGLLSQRRRWWPGVAVAAAIAVAFAAGWTTKALSPVPAAGSRYLLLLYPGDAPRTGGDAALVEEYRQWAHTARAGGRFVSGERLGSEPGVVLGAPGAPPADRLQGYFVIEARSDQDALSIAKRHPHLRHGGRIVIRRIEAT